MARFFAWFYALLFGLLPAGLSFGFSTGRIALKRGTESAPALVVAPHSLQGAWLAADNTIFIFRDDGTMIGRDWRMRELWGSWVRLDEPASASRACATTVSTIRNTRSSATPIRWTTS